jgi:hypothetical protein
VGRARAARPDADERELRALIRRSRVLEPTLKRAWLGVLPLMPPRHRAELRQILLLEAAGTAAASRPAEPASTRRARPE